MYYIFWGGPCTLAEAEAGPVESLGVSVRVRTRGGDNETQQHRSVINKKKRGRAP